MTDSYESESSIDFNTIKSIKVICNIAQDSFVNEQPSHTIYEFFPTLKPTLNDSYYKKALTSRITTIIENPSNPIYHKLSTTIIDLIDIQLVDQDFNPIKGISNKITIVLHIKRCKD